MNVAMRFLLRIADLLAGIVLIVAGLTVVMQWVAIPSEYFIPQGSVPQCASYDKPRSKPYDCSLLPAVSFDYIPTAVSLVVGLIALSWLTFGPRRLPLTDFLFGSIFILVLPVFGRLFGVIAGSAKPAFLLGAIPPLVLLLGAFMVLIRSGGPAFARSTGPSPNRPAQQPAQLPMTQSVAESLEQVEQSAKSLKNSLRDAPPHASEASKRHAEEVIAIGERFLEGRRQAFTPDVVPKRSLLKTGLKRVADIAIAGAIVIIGYWVFLLLLELSSFFQRTS
jgi:hypothetical protein